MEFRMKSLLGLLLIAGSVFAQESAKQAPDTLDASHAFFNQATIPDLRVEISEPELEKRDKEVKRARRIEAAQEGLAEWKEALIANGIL